MVTTEKEAFNAIVAHHAILVGEVTRLTKLMVDNGEPEELAKADLIHYLGSEVVPHAIAEELSIYEAATRDLGLTELIEQMTQEHKTLVDELAQLKSSSTEAEAKEHANRFLSLFSDHVARENELILPGLRDSASVDLAETLGEMHKLFEAAKGVAAQRDSH